MKFLIDKRTIMKPLDQVSKALPSKSTIPIQSEILFRADQNGLTIVAGDSSIAIMAHIHSDDFELIQEGAITLPGKKIVEIIKKVTDDISIEVNGMQAVIKSGKSKFELTGMDTDEYPNFPAVVGESIKLNGDTLKRLISKTIFATSKVENTPILTGIYFRISENCIKLTACDRHRLAQVEQELNNGIDFQVVISNESLTELLKIVGDKDEIELSLAPDKFLAKTKEFSFFSRTLEGTYPETDRTLPASFNTEVTVKTSQLISALERVKIIANEEKTNTIKVSIGDEMEIEAKVGNGTASESLGIEKKGEGFTVSLNAEYVLEALKAINSENSIIHFVANMSPIILKGSDEPENLFLVLPYRTTN